MTLADINRRRMNNKITNEKSRINQIVDRANNITKTKIADKTLWNKFRDDIKNGDKDLYKSLYVTHHSFNGMGNVFTTSRHTNHTYKKDLSIYSDILKNVIIEQYDYKDIINQYSPILEGVEVKDMTDKVKEEVKQSRLPKMKKVN